MNNSRRSPFTFRAGMPPGLEKKGTVKIVNILYTDDYIFKHYSECI